jgi:hypothetical protein
MEPARIPSSQPTRAGGSWQRRALIAGLVALHAALALFSARYESLTYDEGGHFRYGDQILSLDADRFDNSKMPFSALNALPVRLARIIAPGVLESTWQPERIGRIATILFSTLIGFFLYRWAAQWYGPPAGIGALFLYALEPNILAHAGLMTTDIYIMGMTALSVFTFWRFLDRPSLATGLASSLTLGLSQLAKYTGIFLYPLFLLLLLARALGRRQAPPDARRIGRWVLFLLLFIAVSLAVINIGFLFNRTLTPLGVYEFRSQEFRWFQSLPFASRLPVPLPYPYLEGLDLVRLADRTGESYGNVYLLGQTRKPEGFAGYFFVATLFKVPLAAQLAFLLALGVYLLRRRARGFWDRELFLLGPALFFAIYFNFLLWAQIGIRLYLVVFPFCIVFASSLFRDWPSFTVRQRLLAGLGALYMTASVASYFPHYIPYFNELVGSRLHAYRILSDSNIDYGQAEGFLADYLAAHPDAVVEPAEPTAGLIVISVDRLTEVRQAPAWFALLRDTREPVDHVAHAYLVYRVLPEDLADLSP